MNQAAFLYNLQLLDTRISQIKQNIKRNEVVLQDNLAVENAKSSLDEAEKQLEKSSKALKLIEDQVQSLQIKIDQSSSSLYGGSIRIPKELQDLQSELQSLKKRMGVLEEQELEIMLQVEADQQDKKTKQQLYHQAIADDSARKASLRGEVDQLQKTLEKINIERQAVCASISSENIRTYNLLIEKKRGIAVAKNVDSSCSACGSQLRPAEIQSARSSNYLAICETCGRIIFSE